MAKEILQYFSMMLSKVLKISFSWLKHSFTRKQLIPAVASLCLIFGTRSGLYASDGKIGVTVVNYTLDTTHNVNLGYTITINADVTNYDTSTFTGSITFGLRNNEEIITNGDVFNRPPYSGDIITLHGHETIPAIFNVIVTSPYYTPGPDVVVIWPIFAGTPNDSINIPINVVDPSSINNSKEDPITYLITSEKIILKNTGNQNTFKQVRLFNVVGQELYELHSVEITEIPISSLPKGLYVCELIAADGTKQVIRFIYPSAFWNINNLVSFMQQLLPHERFALNLNKFKLQFLGLNIEV